MFLAGAIARLELLKILDFLRKNFLVVLTWPIAALLISGIGWSVLYGYLHEQKHQAERDALGHATALARNYAHQLNRTVEAVDQVLLHVEYEWKLAGGRLELEHMKQLGLFPSASLWDVGIVNRSGVLSTSAIADTQGVNVGDRPYFQAQRAAGSDSLFIGTPVTSRSTNRILIPFSRRLEDSAARFSGAAVVAVLPQYFAANYDAHTMGKYGFLTMLGSDGAPRATWIGQVVNPVEAPPLLSMPRLTLKSGSMLLPGGQWFRDGRSRFVGWDRTDAYPLIALVGLDQQEVMAPYLARRQDEIRKAAWATLAFGVFTLVTMALSVRLAWRQYHWDMTQFTYRLATEGGVEGFFIGRPIGDAHGAIDDFEIIDSNHRGAEMLRQRREELIGKRISHLYEGASPERLMAMLREAMKTGHFERNVEVGAGDPVSARWVHVLVVRSGNNLAVTLRDISATMAHVDELERRSNEDALTGLPNRHWAQVYLPKAVGHAAQTGALLAILFIDLDGFKSVNDTAGHAAGDELLCNAAARLKEAVRPHDQVVRWGGDEFLVLLEQIEQKTDAAQVAARIRQAFRRKFRLVQGAHSVGTSIGISLFPADGQDAETLLRHADVAMYSVKASGKGNFRFYNQKYYDALRARLDLEAELRQAIEQDQFVVYYQPRIDTLTGQTSSLEALVRWAHPTRGIVEPLGFVTLAEETGLILSIGKLVIDKVCGQLAAWSGQEQKLVPVSINVSARQFNETDVAKHLSASLEQHGVDPRLVEVELTESSVMGDSPAITRTLTAIRRMGIKLLVDDFGTGYSSLSQLQKLDFDVLKVDRAFTSEVDRTERGKVLVNTIITMAHALGMRVVAEGVENEAQIDILTELRCDELQGYYFSVPMPPASCQAHLPNWFSPAPVAAAARDGI